MTQDIPRENVIFFVQEIKTIKNIKGSRVATKPGICFIALQFEKQTVLRCS